MMNQKSRAMACCGQVNLSMLMSGWSHQVIVKHHWAAVSWAAVPWAAVPWAAFPWAKACHCQWVQLMHCHCWSLLLCLVPHVSLASEWACVARNSISLSHFLLICFLFPCCYLHHKAHNKHFQSWEYNRHAHSVEEKQEQGEIMCYFFALLLFYNQLCVLLSKCQLHTLWKESWWAIALWSHARACRVRTCVCFCLWFVTASSKILFFVMLIPQHQNSHN